MFRWLITIGLALTLIAPDLALAKGGYVRPPQLQPFHASVLPGPDISFPTASLVGGCGPKRYLDPSTHHCRGPADVH